jgi:hypothetical protein
MENSSENLNELFTALSKAQATMASAIKDSKNPYFKSSYADLTSIWDAIRKPLSDNGLSIMQPLQCEGGMSYLETWLGHTSGQWMRSRIPLTPAKNDAQTMGSYITYMKRYALSAMIGVVADEDDDGEAAMRHSRKEPIKPIVVKKVTEQMEKELQDLLLQDLEYKEKVDEFLGSRNMTALSDLSVNEFEKLMARAKQRKEARNDTAKSGN